MLLCNATKHSTTGDFPILWIALQLAFRELRRFTVFSRSIRLTGCAGNFLLVTH
jgi:hypothetical protein